MKHDSQRRNFVKSFFSLPVLTLPGILSSSTVFSQDRNINAGRSKLKLSLNAFSFNAPLAEKKMSLDDLLQTAAEIGFDGVDLTAYYFPGYPNVPSDDYLYQ